MRLIIGITGLRGVGKSEVAQILMRRGFIGAHPFAGGKAATIGYLRHLGVDFATANEMVHGDLKDTPSPFIPGGQTPRYFMERFGKWLGVDMGVEWTLGAELDRLAREWPKDPVVVESVVYEALALRARGGVIVRVVRPGHAGPEGCETDRFQEAIIENHILVNNGSLADLEVKVDELLGVL